MVKVRMLDIVTVAIGGAVQATLAMLHIPTIMGWSVIYPAASVWVVYGIWFGFWGLLAVWLGEFTRAFIAGGLGTAWLWQPVLIFNVAAGFIWKFYKKRRTGKMTCVFKGAMDYVAYIVIAFITNVIYTTIIVFNYVYFGMFTPILGWTVMWPMTVIANWLNMVLIGLVYAKVLSSYIEKAGLFVDGYLFRS